MENVTEIDYSKVGIDDNFMFGYIMKDEKRCKPFLEQILDIKIDHIEYMEKEKDVDLSKISHSVRLDIYVEDSKTVYNCEMQVKDTKNLPKRSRYYQGQIDLNLLRPGEDYNKLKRTYIIFICKFDLFGEGRYLYTFENRCIQNLQLHLGDDSIKIFINTKGRTGNVSDEFKELIHFLDTSEIKHYESGLVNDLAQALEEARSNEKWRHDYMTWTQMLNEIRNEEREEGRKEGLEEGREEGIKALIIDNMEDGKSKEEILNKLIKRFNLTQEKAEEYINNPELFTDQYLNQ